MGLRRAADVGSTLLTWPATMAHELTHALVATVAADEVLIRDPLGRPSLDVPGGWHEDAAWLIVLAAYAPLIVGMGVAVVGVVWMLTSGLPAPETARGWAVVGVGATWYLVYVMPSPSDIRTAQEGIERVRE